MDYIFCIGIPCMIGGIIAFRLGEYRGHETCQGQPHTEAENNEQDLDHNPIVATPYNIWDSYTPDLQKHNPTKGRVEQDGVLYSQPDHTTAGSTNMEVDPAAAPPEHAYENMAQNVTGQEYT